MTATSTEPSLGDESRHADEQSLLVPLVKPHDEFVPLWEVVGGGKDRSGIQKMLVPYFEHHRERTL